VLPAPREQRTTPGSAPPGGAAAARGCGGGAGAATPSGARGTARPGPHPAAAERCQQLDLPACTASAVSGASVAVSCPEPFTVTVAPACTLQYVPAGSEVR